jgi:capsular polysaccharide biosynthesis protein
MAVTVRREATLDLRDYLRILRKRGWILIFLALFTAGAAVLFGSMQIPRYRSSIVLRVEPARADWGLSNTTKDLLRSYTLQIVSHNTAQRVIDRAQLDMSTDDLLSKLAVSTDSSNFSVRIDAKDTDPAVAVKIAETTGQIFAEDRAAWNQEQDRQNQIDVTINDPATPGVQYSPNLKVNGIAGFVFGFLIGGLLILFLEWLDADLMRTPEQVEMASGLSVLGSIPAWGADSTRTRRIRLPRVSPEVLLALGLGIIAGAALMYFVEHM